MLSKYPFNTNVRTPNGILDVVEDFRDEIIKYDLHKTWDTYLKLKFEERLIRVNPFFVDQLFEAVVIELENSSFSRKRVNRIKSNYEILVRLLEPNDFEPMSRQAFKETIEDIEPASPMEYDFYLKDIKSEDQNKEYLQGKLESIKELVFSLSSDDDNTTLNDDPIPEVEVNTSFKLALLYSTGCLDAILDSMQDSEFRNGFSEILSIVTGEKADVITAYFQSNRQEYTRKARPLLNSKTIPKLQKTVKDFNLKVIPKVATKLKNSE